MAATCRDYFRRHQLMGELANSIRTVVRQRGLRGLWIGVLGALIGYLIEKRPDSRLTRRLAERYKVASLLDDRQRERRRSV